MDIVKRNGTKEPVDVNKIVKSLAKMCKGLNIDPSKIATKVIGGLFDGATTSQIDELTIESGIWMMNENPEYSKAMARVLTETIRKEVKNQEIQSFSQCIAVGHEQGLINDELAEFVKKNARKLNSVIDIAGDDLYEFFGLKTVYDRYLLKHPITRQVIETPQYWLLRVAAGIHTGDLAATIDLYRTYAAFDFMSSTPTLFNSGTLHSQMSSCYLLDSPQDDIDDIYDGLKRVAKLSKFAGGIGQDYTRIRAEGALIKGTNGLSNGIIPFIHTQDASVLAVNQGGKRKGAAALYLQSWHADILDFLQLRDNTGDPHRRAHNLNLANWVPDEFMRRVDTQRDWTLISPDYPRADQLVDLYGAKFDKLYTELEAELEALEVKPKWYKKIPAATLWARMVKTLGETGNGWMNNKDLSNATCMQVTDENGYTVHSSNLCTEILEVTDQDNTAVCNLGSIVLSAHVKDGKIDYEKLAKTVRIAMKSLNKVIDKNFYPIDEAKNSNMNWRPVGLGVMGTQEFLHGLDLCFDDEEAAVQIENVHAFIYYHAVMTSVELAKTEGKFPFYEKSKYAQGLLHFDLYNADLPLPELPGVDFEYLRAQVAEHGVRNSLMIAIAPTATIASIVGVGECTEPTFSNLFTRQTLSGEFVQINSALVKDLKAIGLWNESVRNQLVLNEGNIQGITEIPEHLRRKYRTVWDYSMKVLMLLANRRGRWIDQSQSLNLFMENATVGKISSMYMAAWKVFKLKTSYYLRSRAVSKKEPVIQTSATVEAPQPKVYTDEEAIFCSLDNPEACEACQ